MTRTVPIDKHTITRYLGREWFPQTLADVARAFSCTYDEALRPLLEAIDEGTVVTHHHPARKQPVYTTPTNPNAPSPGGMTDTPRAA